MANSSCVSNWKNQILSDLQNDNEIIKALNLHEDDDPDDLVWSRLFPHYYIPDTQEAVKTYIMVEIDVQSNRSRYEPMKYDLYAYPTITFTVLSHQKDMEMKMAGVSATRIDYISMLLDKKYNGADGFGLGRLQLTSNIAGNLNDTYRIRQLTFQTVDFSDSLCG